MSVLVLVLVEPRRKLPSQYRQRCLRWLMSSQFSRESVAFTVGPAIPEERL